MIIKPRPKIGAGVVTATLKTVHKEVIKHGYHLMFGKTKLSTITVWGPTGNNLRASCAKHGYKRKAIYSKKSCPLPEVLHQWVIDGLSCDLSVHLQRAKDIKVKWASVECSL